MTYCLIKTYNFHLKLLLSVGYVVKHKENNYDSLWCDIISVISFASPDLCLQEMGIKANETCKIENIHKYMYFRLA